MEIVPSNDGDHILVGGRVVGQERQNALEHLGNGGKVLQTVSVEGGEEVQRPLVQLEFGQTRNDLGQQKRSCGANVSRETPHVPVCRGVVPWGSTSAADDLVLGGQVVRHVLHELVQCYATRVHTLCKKIHTRPG